MAKRLIAYSRVFVVVVLLMLASTGVYAANLWNKNKQAEARITKLETDLDSAQRRVDELENTDFAKKNAELTRQLKETRDTLTAQLKEERDNFAKELKQI